jgi:hypothetical protein
MWYFILTLAIYAVSTKDDDPVKLARSLAEESNLPPIYKIGYMDPNILKIFLLVHDCQAGEASE